MRCIHEHCNPDMNKMRIRAKGGVIALTMVAMTLNGCGMDDGDQNPVQVNDPILPPETIALTRAEVEMVQQSNGFAFDLFRQMTSSGSSDLQSKSFIVSPISITYALGMLNNGAAGNTQAQINDVLGFGDTGADSINAFCYKMLKTAPAVDPLTKVLIANTIYMNQGYTLYPDFVQKAKVFYEAVPETRNFFDGETMDVINKWASDHTEQMIEKVLDESSFDPSAVSYLLNAIYFKGSWAKKFDKAKTKDETFRLAGDDNRTITVPMMYQKSEFEYCVIDGYQALRLPYGNGSYQMTLLMPFDYDAEYYDLPILPTAQVWEELNRRMDSTTVAVKLPRFETKTDLDLTEIMIQLGMPDAFDAFKADFSKFCEHPTWIDLMKQVARIKVDEEGTEAAAVTVTKIKYSMDPFFYADHPFIYIISEKSTGAIFFIGQYTGE